MVAADRHLPGVHDHADGTFPAFGRVDELARLELDERHVVLRMAGGSAKQVGAGEGGDERVGGSVDEVAGAGELPKSSVDDHADMLSECGGILEVVSNENGRERELVQELLKLGSHRSLRVRIERGQRLVEEDHARPAGESPGESDPLPLASRDRRRPRVGEMGDAEALEVLAGALLAGVRDVLSNGQVREQCVFLEDEADAPLVRLAEEPARAVEPDVVAERYPSPRRTHEARDRPEHRALAGARRPDEGDGAVDVER